MSQLNEILATLRKKNNLTQEELGAKLGVSAQSISKWENSVSMPDICLLPMIAETLGVSIDELFGISNSHTINNANDLPKKMHEEIFERINHWFDKADAKEAYKKFAEKHDNVASVFFTKDGAVFENKSIGVIFTKAPTEAIKLINDDGAKEFLSILSDPSVFATIEHLATSKQYATVASIANKCALSEKDVRSALEKLKRYQLVNHQCINLEDETVDIWRIQRTHALLFIYTILELAKQASIPADNYFYYRGDGHWCY